MIYAAKPLSAKTKGLWASGQEGNTPEEAALNYARAFGREYEEDGQLLVAVAPTGNDWSGTVQMTEVRGFLIRFDDISVTAL